MNEDNRKISMQAWRRMVDDLCDGRCWATAELPLEIVQTHISVILLGRRHVLKLKKPVDFGFLNYTTLEKRRRACEAEVHLNRRLCPETYLGVRPIVEVNGQPQLAGEGQIIDYGVWMKRLPGDRMLDQLVATGGASEAVMDRLAEQLSAFHRQARRGPEVELYGSAEVIERNWEENFTQTAPYVNRTISATEFEFIRRRVSDWLGRFVELFTTRVQESRICDGHGDLRSESICITDGICIFDCIEFNDRFRCGDVASEVAFLAMDLDAKGRPDLGYYFSECYQRRTADLGLFSLLPFYRCYRAFVRGKVLSFRLDEAEFPEAEQRTAALRARNYFRLARRYATPLQKPTVIAVMGLSGTGKTSLARALAAELGLRVISSDAIRKSLFGDPEPASVYGEGRYNAEANRLTYQTLIERGGAILKESGGVILDATFQRTADRAMAHGLASSVGANWRSIACQLSPELIHRRLTDRTARSEEMSEATWDTYVRQQKTFEPFDQAGHPTHLVLDTSPSLPVTSRAASDWLRKTEQSLW